MFYLTTHSTHFIYGYMASDVILKAELLKLSLNKLFVVKGYKIYMSY